MKKIVYLLLLGLASCQQDDIITEVPKDDWSVIANTAGQIKGQVNMVELCKDEKELDDMRRVFLEMILK